MHKLTMCTAHHVQKLAHGNSMPKAKQRSRQHRQKTKRMHLVDIESQTVRSLLMKQRVSEDVLTFAVNPLDAGIKLLFSGRPSLVDVESTGENHTQLCFKTDSTANSKEEGANHGNSTDSTANSSEEGANTGSNNSDRSSSLMNLAAAGF